MYFFNWISCLLIFCIIFCFLFYFPFFLFQFFSVFPIFYFSYSFLLFYCLFSTFYFYIFSFFEFMYFFYSGFVFVLIFFFRSTFVCVDDLLYVCLFLGVSNCLSVFVEDKKGERRWQMKTIEVTEENIRGLPVGVIFQCYSFDLL